MMVLLFFSILFFKWNVLFIRIDNFYITRGYIYDEAWFIECQVVRDDINKSIFKNSISIKLHVRILTFFLTKNFCSFFFRSPIVAVRRERLLGFRWCRSPLPAGVGKLQYSGPTASWLTTPKRGHTTGQRRSVHREAQQSHRRPAPGDQYQVEWQQRERAVLDVGREQHHDGPGWAVSCFHDGQAERNLDGQERNCLETHYTRHRQGCQEQRHQFYWGHSQCWWEIGLSICFFIFAAKATLLDNAKVLFELNSVKFIFSYASWFWFWIKNRIS